MFYGQIPSKSRKWYLSKEAKKNISNGIKRSITERKLAGTFRGVRDNTIAIYGEEYAIEQAKSVGFNSERGAAAGHKGAGRPNSEKQKRRQSESTKKVAANILICEDCERPCKGPSALGAHRRIHRES